MKDSNIYYSVGPLLYYPANKSNIVTSLVKEKFGCFFSLALCLEDTIGDEFVAQAEDQLLHTLTTLQKKQKQYSFYMPKLFIRVREPAQIPRLTANMGEERSLITGFILPKFSLENADAYLSEIQTLNEGRDSFYIMPILESPAMVRLTDRYRLLYELKSKLDVMEQWVLNIRVGGNDLCNVFGLRRHAYETIYDIRPVADILSDIVTVFGLDYVVSGPVWEYYNGSLWEAGLVNELTKDKLFGFVGKTVIHPKQISLVNQSFMIEETDYQDALKILGWDTDCANLVEGNQAGERMNEYKTHFNWAQKTVCLAKTYGIKKGHQFKQSGIPLQAQIF